MTNKTIQDSANTIQIGGATINGAGVNSGQFLKYNGSNWVPGNAAASLFGGTGADGALAITSGTTTIDCANAAFVVKNYTSISITATGKLAFINPNANGTTVILKFQGNITLTSSTAPMIDMSGMGASGGGAVTVNTNSASAGNGGNSGLGILFSTGAGKGGLATNTTQTATTLASTYNNLSYFTRYLQFAPGAGGGSGAAQNDGGGTSVSGIGGLGGGVLVIECAGAWNFTTASGISVAGKAGGNGTKSGSPTNYMAAPASGGGGGVFLGLYNSLTANSGTVTVSGGAAGSGVSGGGTSGANTGATGGGSILGAASNTSGVATGSGLASATAGANGLSIIQQNVENG